MGIRNPGYDVLHVKSRLPGHIIFCVLLLSAILCSAGCVQTETEQFQAAEITAPADLTAGLLDFTRDARNIDTAISIDLYNLADRFGKAATNAEIKSCAGEYYANNAWLNKLIYYDAKTGTPIEVPIQVSSELEQLLPHPTENELLAGGGSKHYDSVFLPEDGYVNVVCMAVYDKNRQYRGYFSVIYDYYVVLNLHPQVLGKDLSYGNFACSILDTDGNIIYSSTQEYLGTSVTSSQICGMTLLQKTDASSGAYAYESPAFFNYNRQEITKKITAWQEYIIHKTKYTVYLTKEVDKEPIIQENTYTSMPEKAETDVADAFVYATQEGSQALIDRINSGYYETPMGILDYNGYVLALSDNPESIGLTYLNNRGAYGYAYTKNMINTAKQGGGYVYYLYPADDTISTPASEFSVAYILPIEGDCFVFGRFSGDEDLVMRNADIMSDVTKVSREVLKEAFDVGIDAVIAKINKNPYKDTSMFVSGLATNVEDLGIIDYTGTIQASVYNPTVVGYSLTGYRDVYGGSTVRKLIMLAKSGGGYAKELYPNPDKEGYVDLWLYSIEPIDDTYIIYTGAVLKTIVDKSPHLAGLNIK